MLIGAANVAMKGAHRTARSSSRRPPRSSELSTRMPKPWLSAGSKSAGGPASSSSTRQGAAARLVLIVVAFIGVRHSPLCYRARRFTTPTDSVASARSNFAPEMLRALTRTVLFVQAKAVRSMYRVERTVTAAPDPPAASPSRSRRSAKLLRWTATAGPRTLPPQVPVSPLVPRGRRPCRHRLMKLVPPLMLSRCW